MVVGRWSFLPASYFGCGYLSLLGISFPVFDFFV